LTSHPDTFLSKQNDGRAISAGRSLQGVCSFGAARVRHTPMLLSRPLKFAIMASSSSPLPDEHAQIDMLLKDAIEIERSE
jgi:hypothetical protein